MTLRQLIDKYPDSLDAKIAVLDAVGETHHVWGSDISNDGEDDSTEITLYWD